MLKYSPRPYNFGTAKRVHLLSPKFSGKRFYCDGTFVLPSVTTVLGDGPKKGAIIKRWRTKWTRKLAEAGFSKTEIDAYFSLASERGTALHEAVERLHMFGESPDFDSILDMEYITKLEGFKLSIKDELEEAGRGDQVHQNPWVWWSEVLPYLDTLEGEIIAQEIPIFCPELGVAGTPDLIYLNKDGEGVIADYKFTGYAKAAPSKYGSYCWDNPSDQFDDKWGQLEPYARAFNHLVGEDIIKHMHLISTYPNGVEQFMVPIDKTSRDAEVGVETKDYFAWYQSKLESFIYG